MKPIVSLEWLSQHLGDEQLVIVDCRFNLANPEVGEKEYQESHIPGTYYAHLDRHLSGVKQAHGGRHPLPAMEDFKQLVESFGIDETKKVVAYDSGEMMFAGRFWWLLSYLGHPDVHILDGGFKEWAKKGYEVTSEIPNMGSASFTVNLNKEWLASIDEVKSIVSGEKDGQLIDSRAPERYNGEVEPLDRVPGHIPGAVNHFFLEGLTGAFWKEPNEQQKRFDSLDKNKPVVVYCGSGVSATPNIMALKQAGFQDVKLYAGSYSDWSSYEELPIAKK
ncbi:thiosulfate/3-mercaptopyruvate sulfurtransferase [Bacillus ectoiniformans]|uniref:sulfurtransferase n=1 Tax=Bacillus ectoiniformans TaxID=1494429 RepID=UPI0019579221|nr:sulfurtransferase [Bacillus ectoiniformans]MBM7647931.1 thiosulfate/3-mercaptopyruvate sulfurtransferase [Bacillus ectoiniformans]